MKVKELEQVKENEAMLVGAQVAVELGSIMDLGQKEAMNSMYKRNKLVAEIVRVMKQTGHLPREEEEVMSGVEPMEEEEKEEK